MSLSRLSSRPLWPQRSRRGLFLLAACFLLLGPPAVHGAETLQPGVPIERTIQKKETHEYPVSLSAGDFLRVTLDQRGVDVAMLLFAPGGTEIALVDGPGPYNAYSTEDLAAVAATSGLYKIRVLVGGRIAPGATYRLRMESPRPARPGDWLRAEAVYANQAATNILFGGGPAALQLLYREEAQRIWHELRELRREADTLFQIGTLRANSPGEDLEEIAQLFHEAADLYQAAGDLSGQAHALNEAARYCEVLGHTEDALQEYRNALELARWAGDRQCEKNALSNLGVLLNRLGRNHEAVQRLSEALRIARELSWPDLVGSTLINLGPAYQDLPEPQKAIDTYQEALEIIPEQDPNRAIAHNNLGATYEALGDWDKAIEHYNQALELSKGEKTEATFLNNLGLVYQRWGQLDKALEAYQGALKLAGEQGNLEVQVWASNNIGFLYEKLGRRDDALRHWREVPKLAVGRKEWEHVALNAQAAVLQAEGDLDGAREALGHTLGVAKRRKDAAWEAEMTLRLARLEKEHGNLPAALEHVDSAVELVETLRTRVASPDLRAMFLASKQDYYEHSIGILMALHEKRRQEGFDARALQVSERARARSLLDLLTEAGADIIDSKLLEKERQLSSQVHASDRHHWELIQKSASSEEIAEAERKRSEAIAEFKEFQSSQRFATLTQPETLSAPEIQSRILGETTLLLEYSLGKEKSYLWAVTPTSLQSFELPARETIEKEALAYYSAVTARNDLPDDAKEAIQEKDREAERAGHALSDLILKPVEPLLGDHTVLIVSDGALQYVPFAALPLPSSPQKYLMERNEVVSLPSASTLAVLRNELSDRAPAPKLLAVLADPVFTEDDPRLRNTKVATRPQGKRGLPRRGPASASLKGSQGLRFERLDFSREEAENIAKLVVHPDKVLKALDFDASFATATSDELASYQYVHFATHGVLDSSQPELSRLVLSLLDKKGKPQEGFLRLHDIYNLQLNADMVVLSACQTALGKEIRGEGLVGLTRGFMYAGSPRVVASLWSVEDRATAKLMKSFYTYLLRDNLSAPAALRQAQLDLASKPQFKSPYYWAGFSLQGEWK